MYNSYFGFREKPFNVTPDPRFFYNNPVYQEAYASLLYGIRERKGFIVLTGEVGTGKTTILRRLMNNLEATVRSVFFYNTTLSFEELLSFTCDELGLRVEGEGRLQKIDALNEFLIEQLKKGGTGVLLVDEAQNLGEDVLENLRLLSNLETGSEKLLQIVLVGQPELENKLDQPQLRQVKQRIAVRYRLNRLKDREVGPYIDYRLRSIGYEHDDLFTPDGVRQIAFYSQGIPRLINIICDNALVIAYASSKKKVSADMIMEVSRDLRLGPEVPGAKVEIPKAKVAPQNGNELGDKPVQPRSSRLAWAGVGGTFLVFLLLGGAASVIDPVATKTHLSVLGFQVEELIGSVRESVEPLSQDLSTWLRGVGSSDAKPGKIRKISEFEPFAEPRQKPQSEDGRPSTADPGPLAMAEQVGTAISPEFYIPQKYGAEEQTNSTILSSPQVSTATQARSSTSESHPPSVVKGALAGKWNDRSTMIQYGTTIGQIASHLYEANRILGMDLIKEYNPQIEDLNWIFAGEGLRLPPLTKETLLRKRPDGSYHIILASFPNLTEADSFAHGIRKKGYEAVVTTRRVADNFSLYRVEIVGLKTIEAVNQAWETALANQWISLADSVREGKNQQATLSEP